MTISRYHGFLWISVYNPIDEKNYFLLALVKKIKKNKLKKINKTNKGKIDRDPDSPFAVLEKLLIINDR